MSSAYSNTRTRHSWREVETFARGASESTKPPDDDDDEVEQEQKTEDRIRKNAMLDWKPSARTGTPHPQERQVARRRDRHVGLGAARIGNVQRLCDVDDDE